MESFDINRNNEFQENSLGSIEIDGYLSDEEKTEFREAFNCECGEIIDQTNGKLSELIHTDLLPNLEDSGFDSETQSRIRQLAELHPEENAIDLGITIPSELEDVLSQGELDLSIGNAIGDIEEYISTELVLPEDSSITPDEYQIIIGNIGTHIQGSIEGVSDVVQTTIDENPDLSLRELTWIINAKIQEYFAIIRDEILVPIKALFVFSGSQRQEELLENVGAGASRESWSPSRIQRSQENLYMNMEMLKEALMTEGNSSYDILYQYQLLLDREFNLGDFDTETYASVEEELNISLLNENDQQIESEAMFYYVCAVGIQCLPYVGAAPGLAADAVDVFSSHDATLGGLQTAGLIPLEYNMEKTAIDHILAFAGIALTAVGLQALARSRRLADAISRIDNIASMPLGNMISNFSERMGFGEGVGNTLRRLMGIDADEGGDLAPVTNIAADPNDIHDAGEVNVFDLESGSESRFDPEAMIRNAGLNDEERILEAEYQLGRNLSPEEESALIEAHEYGRGGEGEYTMRELVEKRRILESAGFTREESMRLLDLGLAGDVNRLRNTFSIGERVIIIRSDGSRTIANIDGFPGDGLVDVSWRAGDGLIRNKRVDINTLQRAPNIDQELLDDIHNLGPGFLIELHNGSSGYITSRSGNMVSLEVSLPNGDIEYREVALETLITNGENISDIIRFSGGLLNMPQYDNLEDIIQFIRSMNAPGIMGNNGTIYTKGQLLNLLNEIQGGNYGIIDNLTRTGGFREIVRNAVRLNPPKVPHEVGHEIYVSRSNGTIERGWVIESISPERIEIQNIERPEMVRRCDPDEIFSITQIEGGQVELTNVAAEFQRRRLNLLQSELKLSQADFHRLFDGDFGQRNVGNCYFVAAMHSLRESPDFELIMRSSIRRVDGGYEVQIPMLSGGSGRTIFVGDNDIVPQPNPRFGQPNDRGGIDNRRFLEPINGPIGYQVLEMAYIIEKFGSTNRLLAEGGFGSEVLSRISGNNFISQTIGRFGNYGSLAQQNGQVDAFLAFANTYDPRRNIATANSIYGPNGHDSSYFVDGIEIFHTHAYSIMNIDRFNQTITLRNPWAGQRPIMMNFEQFLQAFSQVDGVQINYESLLNNV